MKYTKKFMLLGFTFFIGLTMLAQSNKDMKEIIKYGTYAPSSHNAQMWKIRLLNENTIELFLENKRLLPCVDPNNREAWISMGAFVENCVLAASDLGYQSDVSIKQQSIIIYFQSKQEKADVAENINLIKKRQTIRTPFLNVPLDDATINKLCNYTSNISYYPISTKQGQKIATLTYEAYKVQMQDTAKLDELAGWMTFSRQEEQEKKTGLTPTALGLKGLKHKLFNLFFSKKSVTGKIFINSSLKTARKQINACSGYILIASNDSKITDYINSGRLLEHTWISCIKYQIAVHPMSQALEEHEYYSQLKSALNIESEIQMILRVGKVKKYPKKTARRIYVKNIID